MLPLNSAGMTRQRATSHHNTHLLPPPIIVGRVPPMPPPVSLILAYHLRHEPSPVYLPCYATIHLRKHVDADFQETVVDGKKRPCSVVVGGDQVLASVVVRAGVLEDHSEDLGGEVGEACHDDQCE